MNGTSVKITFYTSNNVLETVISLEDSCTKVEGEDAYVGKFGEAEVKFTCLEQFTEVMYQGIMTTIEQYYNHESIDCTILAFGNLIVPVEKIDAVKVDPIFAEEEIPEENLVTVEVED